tara:strand:- start:3470 stop:3724 length:255 start_codon:yes stop_codon:yes gene_type:complete
MTMEKKNALKFSTEEYMSEDGGSGEWTIYGSMGCGWTRKQLDYMKSKDKAFTFVDCDSEECAGVEGFPTMIHSSGEKVTGFKEV